LETGLARNRNLKIFHDNGVVSVNAAGLRELLAGHS
jgi:hypothetical protein